MGINDGTQQIDPTQQNSSNPDPSAILQSILPTSQINSVTGLHDDQIAAIRGLLAKKDKSDAQDFINQVGPDKARQLADTHEATSPTNNGNSNSSSVLDPLIKAAQQQQTTLPAQQINNPAPPANVQRGNFEQDAPTNIFQKVFGMPQAYQDGQGVTHYKPGGFLQAGRNQDYLDQAKALQGLSGSEPVQPKDSIAYGLEAAKQAATNVPMNQAQQKEYNLDLQSKALAIANNQADQFNTQTKPINDNLQKIDSLIPLGDAAAKGDAQAQASLVAGAKEIYGQAGNILGQTIAGKLGTYLGGGYNPKDTETLINNLKTVRQAMIKKLTVMHKNFSSSIGNLQLGDKTISGRDLLNSPYSSETLSKGDTEGGFKFNGGDPSDKKNWSKS